MLIYRRAILFFLTFIFHFVVHSADLCEHEGPFNSQVRLNTRLIDADNKIANYVISDYQRRVSVYVGKNLVGEMRYSLADDHLFINRMDNLSKNTSFALRHVGTLLFEYAFKKSFAEGKGGHIMLNAIDKAGAAYYTMGLRKINYGAGFLSGQLAAYKKDPSEKNKNAILDEEGCYKNMLGAAAKNLGIPCEEVTFEDAITHGLIEKTDDEFVAMIERNENIEDHICWRHNMQGYMCLSEDMIEKKKLEYDNFSPIGSNNRFRFSSSRITNKEMRDLVATGALDVNNAVEIECKMRADDKRLPFLLSATGLEMMKRNYISGWFIGVYFHDAEIVRMLTSRKGLRAFEQGRIENITDLISHPRTRDELAALLASVDE